MKQILFDTLAILLPAERRKLFRLTFFDTVISLLDIFFLAALLFCIQLYSDETFVSRHAWLPPCFRPGHSLWPVSTVCICFGIKNWLAYLLYERQCRFRFDLSLRMAARNMQDYLDGPYEQFIGTDSSVHAGKISQQPIEFCQNVLEGWQQIAREGALIIFAVVASLAFNAVLFLLLLLILTPPVLFIALFSKKKLHTARTEMKSARDKTWQHVHESIAAFVESNLYNRNRFFTARYAGAQKHLNDQLSTLRVMQALPARISEWFAIAGLFILLWLGPHYAHGINSYITLGAFLAAAYKIIPGVSRIQNLAAIIRTYGFTVKGMILPPAPVHQTLADPVPIHSMRLQRIRYQHAGHLMSSPFTASLEAGDFVLLQGDSGSGKTTLLNLLLGFLEPASGTIAINDQPVSCAERKRYWPEIAYTQQAPIILHESLRNNITLGEEKPDQQKLNRVLTVTGLDRLVAQNDDGMNMMLAEHGKNISGGQRQRVALARALYKQSSVLLLDEPFNELDLSAEMNLLAHLKSLSEDGKIILLISHQDRCLSYCNKSYRIDTVTHPLVSL